MSQPAIRLLTGVDYATLEDFLRPHTATSMFLRSNARAAGLDDHGDMYQASYLGAFDGAELVGVIAHCWNGMILMQSPDVHILDKLYRSLLTLPTIVERGIKGASGDYRQVRFIIDCLKPDAQSVQMNTRESLFALDLSDLKIPPLIQTGKVICRRIEERDLATLLPWRFDYSVEALGASRGDIKEDEEQAFLRSLSRKRSRLCVGRSQDTKAPFDHGF